MEKVVAIILARGGSKGIQKKQIIPLCNKPLIYYCLDACVTTPEIDMIVATTECPIIGKKLKEYHILHQYHHNRITMITDRDPKTAEDTATSEMAVLSTLDRLDKKYDICLLVQATSPFTESKDLQALISLVKNDGYDSAAYYTEDYSFSLDDDTVNHPRVPRQKRKPRRREAGNAWAFKVDGFRKHMCRTFGKIGAYKIDEPKQHEIDTWNDLDLAHYYMRSKKCSV